MAVGPCLRVTCGYHAERTCSQNLLGIAKQRQVTSIWALNASGGKGGQLCLVNTAKGHIWGRRGKVRASFLVCRESSRTAGLLRQRSLVSKNKNKDKEEGN